MQRPSSFIATSAFDEPKHFTRRSATNEKTGGRQPRPWLRWEPRTNRPAGFCPLGNPTRSPIDLLSFPIIRSAFKASARRVASTNCLSTLAPLLDLLATLHSPECSRCLCAQHRLQRLN